MNPDFSAADSQTVSRKRDHVELCVSENVQFQRKTNGLERFDLHHNALTELDFTDIDLTVELFGKALCAPLIISSMTGGYDGATEINRNLAKAARHFGIAISAGSGKQALQDQTYWKSFSVIREENPDGVVLCNIGAADLMDLVRPEQAHLLRSLVDLHGADALAIHLNPLQELLQPEGSPKFRGVLDAIRECAALLSIPILVKEVGAGISGVVARQLLEAGVRAIDVAGAGGTSWAGVEILRQEQDAQLVSAPFWDWGIPTAEAVQQCAELKSEFRFTLIGSGGITNGLEAAKAIALGADLVGVARPFLTSLMSGGFDALKQTVANFLFQLQSAMFLTGSANVAALKNNKIFPI